MTIESATTRSSERLSWRWLAGLLVLALAVRLPFLGRADVWCDEILFLNLSTPPLTPLDALREHWRLFLSIGHLPAVAMLQSAALWCLRIFSGEQPETFWLRLPSALWSALAIVPLAQLGTLLGGRRVGLMAGIAFATFFYPVYYGREVYYYAGLALFSATGLYLWFSALTADRPPAWGRMLGLTLALGAVSCSHVTGILLPLGLLPLALVWLVRPPDGLSRAVPWRLALCSFLGLLPALPFYLQKLHGTAAPFHATYALSTILADGLGKQLFGMHPVALVAALVPLLCGLAACFGQADGRRWLRLGFLAVVSFVAAAVIIGALRSLYNGRYFNVVNGALYIVFALGLEWALGRVDRKGRLAFGVLALAVVTQIACFILPMYALPAKAVNYGGIARWLTTHLPPGTPYVLESGYEMRFVPGYFPTPGLVAACPYVHGRAPGDIAVLWERQQKFFEQFPEAVYVESAHHGADTNSTTGIFKWPREHFKNRVDLRNEPLLQLARRGVGQTTDELGLLINSLTSIYYNTPADNDAIARASGKPVRVDYPGWQVQQIQDMVYARIVAGPQGTIVIRNLADHPLSGRLVIPIGLAAPAGLSFQVNVLWQGQVAGSLPLKGGAFQTLRTETVVLKPGQNELTLRVGGGDMAQLKALAVPQVEVVLDAPR